MNMGKRSGPGNWCKFDEHRSADPAATEIRPALGLGTRSLYIYKPCICGVGPGINSLCRWREASHLLMAAHDLQTTCPTLNYLEQYLRSTAAIHYRLAEPAHPGPGGDSSSLTFCL